MRRDGLSEKPPAQLGPKQWLLLQLIACVPLSYWSETTGATPSQLIEALPEEFGELLLSAWMRALAHVPDPIWIEPLLGAASTQVPLECDVLRAVPVPRRAALVATLAHSAPPVVPLDDVCAAWRPLGEDLSRQIVECWDPTLVLYSDAAFSLNLAALGPLESRLLASDGGPAQKRRVDEVLSAIAMRRALHEELAP